MLAPDGIERFDDAWQGRVVVEGFSVAHIDDIIASKEVSNRGNDRESLPPLRSFRECWRQQRRWACRRACRGTDFARVRAPGAASAHKR